MCYGDFLSFCVHHPSFHLPTPSFSQWSSLLNPMQLLQEQQQGLPSSMPSPSSPSFSTPLRSATRALLSPDSSSPQESSDADEKLRGNGSHLIRTQSFLRRRHRDLFELPSRLSFFLSPPFSFLMPSPCW